ncbi:MAG: hypothetical protein JW719_04790 [Pirellulales bacterium]|nr:hypothetical protein [Pirellulales bacterium]
MAVPGTGRYCCLRCGKPVGREPSAPARPDCAPDADQEAASREETALGAAVAASGYDGWELDEQLRHVARRLGMAAQPSGAGLGKTHRRIDAAHGSTPEPHFDGRPARRDADGPGLGGALLGAFAWFTLMLGLMASTCGGVLLIWSVVVDRAELWNVGLPIAVGGVLALFVAMVLQLERLAADHRRSAARLARFDSQLVQLRRDTAVSAADARPAGAAFYAHLAGGASPQLLLTDLKGQLELLADRLGQSEAASFPPSELE